MEPAARATSPEPVFDVFLSHNGRDKPIVERDRGAPQRAGLEPWLDKWDLTPGGGGRRSLTRGCRPRAPAPTLSDRTAKATGNARS